MVTPPGARVFVVASGKVRVVLPSGASYWLPTKEAA